MGCISAWFPTGTHVVLFCCAIVSIALIVTGISLESNAAFSGETQPPLQLLSCKAPETVAVGGTAVLDKFYLAAPTDAEYSCPVLPIPASVSIEITGDMVGLFSGPLWTPVWYIPTSDSAFFNMRIEDGTGSTSCQGCLPNARIELKGTDNVVWPSETRRLVAEPFGNTLAETDSKVSVQNGNLNIPEGRKLLKGSTGGGGGGSGGGSFVGGNGRWGSSGRYSYSGYGGVTYYRGRGVIPVGYPFIIRPYYYAGYCYPPYCSCRSCQPCASASACGQVQTVNTVSTMDRYETPPPFAAMNGESRFLVIENMTTYQPYSPGSSRNLYSYLTFVTGDSPGVDTGLIAVILQACGWIGCIFFSLAYICSVRAHHLHRTAKRESQPRRQPHVPTGPSAIQMGTPVATAYPCSGGNPGYMPTAYPTASAPPSPPNQAANIAATQALEAAKLVQRKGSC